MVDSLIQLIDHEIMWDTSMNPSCDRVHDQSHGQLLGHSFELTAHLFFVFMDERCEEVVLCPNHLKNLSTGTQDIHLLLHQANS